MMNAYNFRRVGLDPLEGMFVTIFIKDNVQFLEFHGNQAQCL
jgi:hypothetical protein